MKRSSVNARWWLLQLALMPVAVSAHNGAVALAVPVEGIEVDGDFSDWPKDLRRYPIALWGYGDRLKDEQDLQGFFRVGYQAQEKALYIAVEIEDDSVIEDGEALGNTQDGCEINVELRHGEKGSAPIPYRIWGRTRGGSGAGRVEDAEVQVQRGEKGRRYEWRLDLGRMSEGQVYRDPEIVLGFDVALYDKDGDGSASSVSWGGGGILGDLVLVEKGEKLGQIQGRMKWEGLGGGIAYGKVRIQSLESERLWMQVEADQEGVYRVEVPAGRYRVESELGRGRKEPPVVEVRAGSEAQVELAIPVPHGEQVDFNWGKGQWHTYDATAGLVSGTVMALLQDWDGNMWFGTWGGGVSRYDGQHFRTYDTRDGLVGTWVTAISQDRKGIMWFGTGGGGVSRFDGQVFQGLAQQDGLADNTVDAIAEDQEGNIWLGTGKGLTRFRPPPPSPPPVFVDAVVADQRYEQVREVSTPSTVKLIAFEFHGISFKTRPEAMVYRYRLNGHDLDWRTTHSQRVEYQELPAGEYTFEVQAVDRDLSYSEQPAQVRVSIHLPYERLAWISVTIAGILLFLWQTVRIVRRDRKLQVANRDLGQANHTLRETQAQLVQAEKLATVGLLAGGGAHELNNPLQALLQGAQRILRYPEDVQRHQQSASLMEQAAQRCSAIVQNLLSYTRRSGGEFAPVDLNAVVDSILALLQSHLEQAGIAVRVERGALPLVKGNFNELCTVLTNLLMNARDALAAEGGKGIIEITTAEVSGEVVLKVRDNGPGIPVELRERIFDPFYTTKPVGSGTGLGLSIVQGIVQRHQGRIAVESGEGGGTAFVVHLPVQI